MTPAKPVVAHPEDRLPIPSPQGAQAARSPFKLVGLRHFNAHRLAAL
jgi:hypothetical protein